MRACVAIFGAPGSGKSTVLERLAERLEDGGVEYGAIETEQLGWGSPPLAFDLIVDQLRAILTAQRVAGRAIYLVAATVEEQAQLDRLVAALASDTVITVALDAPPDICAERVAARERDDWIGKRGLISASRELATRCTHLPADLRIDTGRVAPDVAARRVMEALRASGEI